MSAGAEVSEGASRVLAALLEARTGQQLTIGRRWRIETGLKGLLRARGHRSVDDLVAHLAAAPDPDLADEVVEALLNNETYFFRDRAPFDLLRDRILPSLRDARARQRRLSIWCAGVSTGQEAYSLAMTFAEDRERWVGWRIDIVGTDVSRSAIERARTGTYSQFEVQRGLPVLKMVRWFGPDGGDWRVASVLRRAVRFEVRSVLDEPPAPGLFDIVLCRNLLIYFAPATRRAGFARLAQGLAPDGMLMLGAGETVIGQTECFTAADLPGVYRPRHDDAAPARRAVSA